MARHRMWVLVGAAVVLGAGCGDPDYAEGLEQPPTDGVATAGPGSGDTLAAQLHDVLQTNNPETLFEDPSWPEFPVAEPGATVTCELTVGEEQQRFLLRMDDEGEWQISDG